MRTSVVFFALLFSLSAHALTCKNVFDLSPLKNGQMVNVVLHDRSLLSANRETDWVAGDPLELVVVGRTQPNKDLNEPVWIFTDSNLDTYYFRGNDILIDGQPGGEFRPSRSSFLPPMIYQTEGSCNLCANVSAINALALREGIEPVTLSGRQIESDSQVNEFSYHQNVRMLLDDLYVRMWPEGYTQGSKPSLAPKDILTIFSEFKSRTQKANQDAIRHQVTDNERANDEQPRVNIPFDLKAKETTQVSEFLSHLSKGGKAVVGGIVDRTQTQNMTTTAMGYHTQVPKAGLIPYQRGVRKVFRSIGQIFTRTKALSQTIKRLESGEAPNDQMVADLMPHMASEIGHAVAAIGLLETGPLEGHVIVLNSWGAFEVHSPRDFQDGVHFLLIDIDQS